MSSFINILLELPDEIIAGLESGKYERVGGVIRETNSKHVRLWLKEIWSPTGESANNITPQMLQQLNIRQSAVNNISMGINSWNLATNIAMFAYMVREMEIIKTYLKDISEQIRELSNCIEGISKRQDQEQLAKLISAMDIARRACISLNKDIRVADLRDARNMFTNSRNLYYQILKDIIRQNQVFRYPEPSFVYAALLIYAIIGEVRCSLYLNETRTAVEDLETGIRMFNDVKAAFLREPKPFEQDLLMMPSKYVPTFKEHRLQIQECQNYLDGFKSEIEQLNNSNILYDKFEDAIRLNAPKNTLVFVEIISQDAEKDLIPFL
jgi:prefoldin subunit 5